MRLWQICLCRTRMMPLKLLPHYCMVRIQQRFMFPVMRILYALVWSIVVAGFHSGFRTQYRPCCSRPCRLNCIHLPESIDMKAYIQHSFNNSIMSQKHKCNLIKTSHTSETSAYFSEYHTRCFAYISGEIEWNEKCNARQWDEAFSTATWKTYWTRVSAAKRNEDENYFPLSLCGVDSVQTAQSCACVYGFPYFFLRSIQSDFVCGLLHII